MNNPYEQFCYTMLINKFNLKDLITMVASLKQSATQDTVVKFLKNNY